MRFAPTSPKPRPREAIVPMINVVFLLLIFFLMTASIGARPPFDLALPEGTGDAQADAPDVLFIAADGTLAFGAARGEAAVDAIAAMAGDGGVLDIRADRSVPAAVLAGLLPRLAEIGIAETRLVTVRE